LCQFGFGIIAIIGVNPNEAQAGDIVVELMQDGARGWVSGARFQMQYHFTSYLS